MAGLSQADIDSVRKINDAIHANSDWFPSDLTKLQLLIHAQQEQLLLRPRLAQVGGSSGEVIGFDIEVTRESLEDLKAEFRRETRVQGRKRRPGLITAQHQLSRKGERWGSEAAR